MPTIKNYRKDRYTTIDNAVLDRPDLSWRAKGILAYLIGKPKDWEVRLADLTNRATEGRDATRTALQELKALGYLVVIAERDQGGKIVDNTTYVSDRPEDLADLLETRRPDTEALENRSPDKPEAGESNATNKEVVNKKRSLTKDEKKLVELLPDIDLEKRSLFKNSASYPWEIFRQFFGEEYLGVDVRQYYEVIANWNENKRTVRTPLGWILTIRGSIARDAKKGIVRRDSQGQAAQSEGMASFLKLGRT